MKYFVVALILVASLIGAQDAEVTYVDYYEVEVKKENGVTFYADFGDQLQSGDSVVTTRRGSAELDLASGGTVKVSENTIYTISQIETSDGPQTVMSVALGSVRFRFNTLAGSREPTIGTPTSVAGVRGTEFVAHVAVDGSTVFLVEEGAVEVTSAGSSVQLVADRGVEVLPGEKPGETFDVLERAFDFSTYNATRQEELLRDPVAAAVGVRQTMTGFFDALEVLIPEFQAKEAALIAAREKLADVRENGTKAEADTYYEDTYVVIRDDRQLTYKNMRFYARSALSLRHYVLGRISVLLELEGIFGKSPDSYDQYLDIVDGLLADYERIVVPALEVTDI